MIRLNRYVASATKYSRRQAEGFIKRGDIAINGKIIKDLATKVNHNDQVTLRGQILTPLHKVYYILNKPAGYVCTLEKKQSEKRVVDLVPSNPPVFTVGRLDKETKGLLILTNDGDFAQHITHPSNKKEKEYLVKLNKELSSHDQYILLKGIKVDNKLMKFDKLLLDETNTYRVVLHQGYNRQIRKMFDQIGYQVLDLIRVRIGNFLLRDLPEGKFLKLNFSDIKKYFL